MLRRKAMIASLPTEILFNSISKCVCAFRKLKGMTLSSLNSYYFLKKLTIWSKSLSSVFVNADGAEAVGAANGEIGSGGATSF